MREVAHGHVGSRAEYQPRILVVPEMVAEALFEVAPLLAFGAEPGDGPIREHAVQDHQALNGAFDRDSPAVSVVRLSDGRVERLVVNVEDACPSGRPELNCGDESPRQDPFDEVVDLLSVGDPGERRVLPADEHAGVQHDSNQEARLTIGETERCDGSSGLDRETVCIRHTGDGRIQGHNHLEAAVCTRRSDSRLRDLTCGFSRGGS